jgi:hypothetical protein
MATTAVIEPELYYENRLRRSPTWSIDEGGMHVHGESEVYKALRRFTQQLDQLQIPYALAGAMALNFHGYQRFTVDIDIILTRESLQKVHAKLEGKGYLPPFKGSKNLRDTENKVAIDLIVAGDFPGDGKPQDLTFPNPAECFVEIEQIKCLPLEKLIELKLAAGMTAPDRLKDLADVQELIKARAIPRSFVDKLHPYVQAKFLEIYPERSHSTDAFLAPPEE